MKEFDRKDPSASAAFEKWRNGNSAALFVNFKSPNNMMLHKTDCGHFVFGRDVNLVRHKKICSSDRRELEDWAKQFGELRNCPDCKP